MQKTDGVSIAPKWKHFWRNLVVGTLTPAGRAAPALRDMGVTPGLTLAQQEDEK